MTSPIYIYVRQTPCTMQLRATRDLVFFKQPYKEITSSDPEAQLVRCIMDGIMAHARASANRTRPYYPAMLPSLDAEVKVMSKGKYARVTFIEANAQRQRRFVLIPAACATIGVG